MKNKKVLVLGIALILMAVVVGMVSAERQVTSREMERLVNSVFQNSERAKDLALQNYKMNEANINSLLSKVENDLIAIENRQNKGEKLVASQEQKIQSVNANLVTIARMKEKAGR